MKLFVGNLPHALTEQELHDLFSSYGTIDRAKLILDRETGRSRGFAFVEMNSEEEAKKAMDELNGKEVGGRAIVVNEARDKERKEGFGNRRSFSNNRRERRRF